MKLRLRGIVFEISYPLAAVMTAVILYDRSMSVLACLISVVIHESGHLLMLRRYGCKPDRIRLTLFDIAILDKRGALRGMKQELAVTVAGAAMNTLWGLFFLTAGQIWFRDSELLTLLVNANFTLAFFNMLPAETLDGGQALLLILCSRLEPKKAMLIRDIVSVFFIIPLGILGFLVLLRSVYNFTLLLTAVYLMAVLIMKDPHFERGK